MNPDIFTPHARVLENEPMSRHTSFKIGGEARLFLTPYSANGLINCLRLCRENDIPVFILGNGSNLLVSDLGIEGAVIRIGEGMDEVRAEGNFIIAGAGARLGDVCRAALNASLTGLEFAYGIPGSIGGGIFMNAGAYGGELKDVCVSVTAVTKELETVTYSASDCDFAYRHSRFAEDGGIVTEAVFELKKGDKAEIKAKMDDILSRRKDKQPLEYPSAGSVFRRPEGYFAGALIQEAGLKGVSVGGAQVSEKHAGFIINRGGATCEDVRSLIKHIQDKVYENSGVTLECEVCFVGRGDTDGD